MNYFYFYSEVISVIITLLFTVSSLLSYKKTKGIMALHISIIFFSWFITHILSVISRFLDEINQKKTLLTHNMVLIGQISILIGTLSLLLFFVKFANLSIKFKKIGLYFGIFIIVLFMLPMNYITLESKFRSITYIFHGTYLIIIYIALSVKFYKQSKILAFGNQLFYIFTANFFCIVFLFLKFLRIGLLILNDINLLYFIDNVSVILNNLMLIFYFLGFFLPKLKKKIK